ncbi:hypothetical protein KKG61_06005 [bacterium]|nr:hypothetical protein [bacterium]MBU1599641.1 hypothetical protein [bacterium]MBU2461844.1 hypothetical protein [bacterium]
MKKTKLIFGIAILIELLIVSNTFAKEPLPYLFLTGGKGGKVDDKSYSLEIGMKSQDHGTFNLSLGIGFSEASTGQINK